VATLPRADWLHLVAPVLHQKGQSAYPHIVVPSDRFAAYLARCLPAEPLSAADLDALVASDLYLSCAYGLGISAAQQHIEQVHFARIARRLARMALPAAVIADVLQDLRCSLVEQQDAGFSRRGYAGRGSLGGWLFIAAVRIAERSAGRTRQEQPVPDSTSQVFDRRVLGLDPEMEHIIQSSKATFEAAMRDGLAALSSRERNLLRYHFLEKLGIDRLAELYQIHRATAARWILHAQQRLAQQVHQHFAAQIPIAADSMPRLLALVRSRLDLHLSALLQRTSEPEG
jgi:RNA polymerase sigma-70 factor (ECF subfamily)